jgi:hypothetical protein
VVASAVAFVGFAVLLGYSYFRTQKEAQPVLAE